MKHFVSDYSFEDYPVPLRMEDYEEVKKKIVDKLSRDSSVISLYSFGRTEKLVNDPGISDLDFIIIFDESKDVDPEDYRVSPKATKVEKYIRSGSLGYPVNRDFFQEIKNVFDVRTFDYYYLCGERIKIKPSISQDQVDLGNISTFIELFFPRLRFLSEAILSKRIKIRKVISTLDSFYHELPKLKRIGYQKPSWDSFCSKMKNLRKEWFFLEDERRKNQLINLLHEGFLIFREAIDVRAEFLVEKGFMKSDMEDNQLGIFTSVGRTLMVFNDNLWQKNKFPFAQGKNFDFSEMLPASLKKSSHLTEWNIAFFPYVFCRYIYFHTKFEGILKKEIRRRTVINFNLKENQEIPYPDAFKEQSRIFNAYWEFLQKKRFPCAISALTKIFYEVDSRENTILKLIRRTGCNVLGGINKRRTLKSLLKEVDA